MPNKFVNQLPNFIKNIISHKVITMLNIDKKYLRYRYGVTQVNLAVTLHLRSSNKQADSNKVLHHYTNNAPLIGNQNAKFKLNLPKQTITTAVFVRSPRSTSVFIDNKCTKHQFIHLLTATFKDLPIENSKNYKR